MAEPTPTASQPSGADTIEAIDLEISNARKEGEALRPATMGYDRFTTKLDQLYRRKVELEKSGQNPGRPPAGATNFEEPGAESEPSAPPEGMPADLAQLKTDLGIARTEAIAETLGELFPDGAAADRFAAEMGLSTTHQRDLLVELDSVVSAPFDQERHWVEPEQAMAKAEASLKHVWGEAYASNLARAQSTARKIPGLGKWMADFGVSYDPAAQTRVLLMLARISK